MLRAGFRDSRTTREKETIVGNSKIVLGTRAMRDRISHQHHFLIEQHLESFIPHDEMGRCWEPVAQKKVWDVMMDRVIR